MEYHDQCLYDFLQVFDGPDDKSPSLGRFCGKTLPNDLKGGTNKLTIKFMVDESINKPGFSLKFFSGKKSIESFHPVRQTDLYHCYLITRVFANRQK